MSFDDIVADSAVIELIRKNLRFNSGPCFTQCRNPFYWRVFFLLSTTGNQIIATLLAYRVHTRCVGAI